MSSSVRIQFTDGGQLTGFTSFQLNDSFIDPLDRMTVEFAPSPSQVAEYSKKLKPHEFLAVLVDDRPQAALMIQSVSRRVSPRTGTTFRVDCVSPLKVPYEATPDSALAAKLTKSLQADAPIGDLIHEALAPFGFDEVAADGDLLAVKTRTGKGIGASAISISALKHGDTQVQPNETVYQFLGRIITRLGVMLKLDPSGQLYLTAPHYDGEPLYTIKTAAYNGGPPGDRFFGDVEISESSENQPSFVEVVGVAPDSEDATYAGVPKARVESTEINNSIPPFRASSTVNYKPVFIRDPNCRDASRARSVALLRIGLAAKDAFKITGMVQGFTSREGIPWTVDTLVRVYIESLGFNEVMWISDREFRQDASGGQTTSLTMIPKGYLVLGEVPQ